MDPLSVRLIKNSVVYPTIRVASHPGKLLMGVYDDDGEYVEGTVLDRRAGEQGAPVPRELFPVVTDSATPEAIYAGTLYFHFGHFLLESLARAWYAAQQPDLPLVWAGQHTWQKHHLQPWQLEILDLLGIRNPTQVVTGPARFDLLHIPDLGYRYDDRFHPEHADFLGRYEGPAQEPGHRLWLSRSRIETDVRDLNAGPTERRLVEAGWTVAYPETLGIAEQLDQLRRAEVVAGEEGSAFHLVMLLKDVATKKFHILRRHGREHGNLHTIGDVRGIDQTFHSVKRELVLHAEGRVVSKVTPNSSEILDLLAVPVPPAREAATAFLDATLERVLATLAPRRFLEVGAARPNLVVTSTAPTRVAVGPRFAFDPRSYAATGIDFYELGLEQYADLFATEGDRFDVIRIAGPTLADVSAAFRTSQRLAHEGTVWLFGPGDFAARVALAIRLLHPGFTARRLLTSRRSVYIAQRAPEDPRDEAELEELSVAEVHRRLRWLPPVSLRRLQQRTGDWGQAAEDATSTEGPETG